MEERNLLSGLNEAPLRLLLEAAVGVPITSLAREVRPAPGAEQGVSGGEQRLVTFRYTTRDGRSGDLTLFVKRCAWKRRSEAVHYRHLGAHGVPTPRLYGALESESGEEIVFLEPLTATGFRSDSEVEWRAMLSLLARFNACAITPDYAPHLHRYEQVGNYGGGSWLLGMNASPTDEEVAAGLRASSIGDPELAALQQAARALFAQVAAQPRGLLHQDYLSNNLGWRGEREEMVVFDLHKNAEGPRFADVAPYLGRPDWSDSATFLDCAESGAEGRRERLIRHYLGEYARFGGLAVSPGTFRAETAALSWMHKVSALPWLAEKGEEGAFARWWSFCGSTAAPPRPAIEMTSVRDETRLCGLGRQPGRASQRPWQAWISTPGSRQYRSNRARRGPTGHPQGVPLRGRAVWP